MKKLLCLLGLTIAFPLAIAPEAQACSTPVLMAQALPEVDQSLVDAFAPPQELPVPTQPCHRQMDEVSRELVLAALRAADQIPDPAEKTEAILELFWTYKHFELPSAYGLLAVAEREVRQVQELPRRFDLTLDIANAYGCFGGDDEVASAREAAMIGEAWMLLQQASPDGQPSFQGNLGPLIFWYKEQGDSTKVEWLQQQLDAAFLEQMIANGMPEVEAIALLEEQREFDAIEGDGSMMQLSSRIEELSAAIEAEGPEALNGETIDELRQMLSQIPAPSLQFPASVELAQLLLQAEQFEAARDLTYEIPLPEDYSASITEWGMELDDNAIRALMVVGSSMERDSGNRAIAFVDAFPASDPNGPGLQAAARVLVAMRDFESENGESAQPAVDEAIELARRLENQNHQAQVLMLAAMAQQELQLGDKAQALMEEALAIAPSLAPWAKQFTMMWESEDNAAASSEAESWEAADRLYSDFYEAMEAKDLDKAESLAAQFTAGDQMSIFVQLAGLQSQQKKPDRALRSLEKALTAMDVTDLGFESSTDMVSYGIISSFSYAGGSITLLPQILALLPAEQVDIDTIKLTSLENWTLSPEHPEAVSEALALMAQVDSLPNGEARTELWNRWLTEFAAAGAWTEALAYVAQLPSGHSQVDHLTNLAVTYSKQETPPDAAMQAKLKEAAQSF